MRLVLLTAFTIAAFATPVFAQSNPAASSTSDVERGFGMGWDSFDRPIEMSTRDSNGNRLIVNGRTMSETTLSGGLGDGLGAGVGSSQAVGNQLNVVTQGNWNTVIIDSTQINNGDISAVTQGGK